MIAEPAEAAKHLPAGGKRAILGEADAALPGFEPNNPKVAARLPVLPPRVQDALRAGPDAPRAAQGRARAPRGRARPSSTASPRPESTPPTSPPPATPIPTCPTTTSSRSTRTARPCTTSTRASTSRTEHRSLLIDAGAEVDGYAADITRTWGDGDERSATWSSAVDREQQALCGKVRAGTRLPRPAPGGAPAPGRRAQGAGHRRHGTGRDAASTASPRCSSRTASAIRSACRCTTSPASPTSTAS